jgi:hypothetical protein
MGSLILAARIDAWRARIAAAATPKVPRAKRGAERILLAKQDGGEAAAIKYWLRYDYEGKVHG